MNKGYMTSLTAIVVVLIGILITVAHHPAINTQKQLGLHLDAIGQHHLNRAARERVLAQLTGNISYEISPYYEDLGAEVSVEILDTETEVFHEGRIITEPTQHQIHVYSATQIEIAVNGDAYIALHSPSGELVMLGEGIFSDIYDPVTDTYGYGYGQYTLETVPDGEAAYSITFTDVKRRILRVGTRILRVENRNGTNILEWVE